ncbi:UNVERIFIED_CONTAM: phloem protein 2 [Sesamum radiatum]|uniref:Phloem protein 2 n=1 Tax=Sesamum radiatum TaxID=300843 RepID=A0AAW2R0P5_SESRA
MPHSSTYKIYNQSLTTRRNQKEGETFTNPPNTSVFTRANEPVMTRTPLSIKKPEARMGVGGITLKSHFKKIGKVHVILTSLQAVARSKVQMFDDGGDAGSIAQSTQQSSESALLKSMRAIIRKPGSRTSHGAGSSPEWNETFLFTVSRGVTELKIKILDKDTFTDDDFLGEVTIPLEPVFAEESIEPMSYRVVKDKEYRGEIRVGLKFTHQVHRDREFGVEEFGGWKQSSLE